MTITWSAFTLIQECGKKIKTKLDWFFFEYLLPGPVQLEFQVPERGGGGEVKWKGDKKSEEEE